MGLSKTLNRLKPILIVSVMFCLSSVGAWASQGGYSTDKGVLGPYDSPTPVDGNGKKLLAIYMVGSDLESGGEAGTNDFNELIQGYQNLSGSNVNVVVAFGGADKDGWKGMKFANMAQIIEDGKDGQYGNETSGSYLYVADGAHMGDESSLKLFLDYLKDGFSGHDSSFLTLWDHGGAYTGFGNDENFNMDGLSLTEISNALNNSGIATFDLIGFDACLMGSLEVARFVKPYSRYLIGSEELEPGHGWNWTSVIQQFSSNASIVDAGKGMIDNFVQDVHNYTSDGKTLSLLDLSKYDDLVAKVDVFASTFSNQIANSKEFSDALIHGTTNARDFGKQSKEDQRVSVDLKHLLLLIKPKLTDTQAIAQIDNLIAGIDSFVVYAKNDGTRPNSLGVSIAPLENTAAKMDQFKLNATWLSFQSAFASLKNSDTTKPEISDMNTDVSSDDYEFDDDYEYSDDQQYYSKNQTRAYKKERILPFLKGERAAFVAGASNKSYRTAQAVASSVKGISATFSDDNLASVSTIFGYEFNADLNQPDEIFFLSVAELEAYKTSTPGQYFTPMWNKEWYCVAYDPAATMTEWMPMVFDSRYTVEGKTYTEYTAEIDYYQKDKDYSGYDYPADLATLRIKVDENNNVVNHSVQTYKMLFSGPDDTEGTVLIDKATKKIGVGDKIQFFTYGYNIKNPELSDWFETSDKITFAQEPQFKREYLEFEDDNGKAVQYKYAMWAKDINSNGVMTDLAVASKGDEEDDDDDDSTCFISSLHTNAAVPGIFLILGFTLFVMVGLHKRKS